MIDEVKNNVKSDEAISKDNWNNFVIKNGGSFLQSWEWGEFQAGSGKLTVRFSGRIATSGVEWKAQFIENKLPGVNKFYWHCPRGPVMATSDWPMANSKIQEIIERVKGAAGKGVIFFRLGPEAIMEQLLIEQLNNLGFQQLPYDIEPSQTQILDITKTEDELLAQMHEKTRYNIRLAERKGVQIKLLVSDTHSFEHYFDEFYRLVSEGTAERKNIRHYSKEYYKKQLTVNSKQFRGVLFIAEYENKVVAANIVVIFGNRATYLHGATDNNARNLMAPHLLQWEQIKYAKAQGRTEYDFWGIVNDQTLDKRGNSWGGFTRFKKGFGGQEVNYVGYWDYPLDKFWYSLYRLVQKFRR